MFHTCTCALYPTIDLDTVIGTRLWVMFQAMLCNMIGGFALTSHISVDREAGLYTYTLVLQNNFGESKGKNT